MDDNNNNKQRREGYIEGKRMVVETKVIVIGAGPSGLAASGCLSFHSIPYILLERDDCIAPLWQKKTYDRLHLHLPRETCQLPHFPIPSHWPQYLPRKLFVQYMQDYASNFNINPIYNNFVEFVKYEEEDKSWFVRAKNVVSGEMDEYKAKFVVIASGLSCDPFMPEVEGLESFPGKIMHSVEYKNGKEFRGKRVLVVGSGNSGMEIAFDLANYGSITSIVVKSPNKILTREMSRWILFLAKYIPMKWLEKFSTLMSRLVFGDMAKYGFFKVVDGPTATGAKYRKHPIIDIGTCKKIRSGEIQVLPAVTRISSNNVVFANGMSHPFDAIIFATGFKRTTNQWLQGDYDLLDEDGYAKGKFPNNWKGMNGLYSCGLTIRGIFGAGVDAQSIAKDILSQL